MDSILVNYIYDAKGEREYAVVPYSIWLELKLKIEHITEIPQQQQYSFHPSQFRGILKPLKLDIEHELKEIKGQWKKNI